MSGDSYAEARCNLMSFGTAEDLKSSRLTLEDARQEELLEALELRATRGERTAFGLIRAEIHRRNAEGGVQVRIAKFDDFIAERSSRAEAIEAEHRVFEQATAYGKTVMRLKGYKPRNVQAAAPPPPSQPMAKPNNALSAVGSYDLLLKPAELKALQKETARQFSIIEHLRCERTHRAIFVGLMLHRVKASLKHGEFGKWQEKHLPAVSTGTIGNYMKLALVFLKKGEVDPVELLAVKDVAPKALAKAKGPAAVFVEKLNNFVGEHDLTELLIKHGIRAVGLKTALENSDQGKSATSAEDYYANVAKRVYDFREIVTSPESLQRLSPQQLDTLKQEVTDSYSTFNRLYEEARGRATALPV